MNFVESPLSRFQLSFGKFIEPSDTPWGVGALKAQIELRKRALAEIELIRRRLLFMSGEKQVLSSPLPRKRQSSRSRVSLCRTPRARSPADPVRLDGLIARPIS